MTQRTLVTTVSAFLKNYVIHVPNIIQMTRLIYVYRHMLLHFTLFNLLFKNNFLQYFDYKNEIKYHKLLR